MISTKKIFTPIIIAASVICGMFIGRTLTQDGNGASSSVQMGSHSKIDAVLQLIGDSYVDSVNRQKIEEDAIPILLEELDPHSSYIPAKDMVSVNEEMTGNFGGIGVQFSIVHDTVQVIDVISGGPSAKLGLLPGDRITTVGDSLIVGVENETVLNLLRGEKGTVVKVGIVRKGIDGLIWYDITRDDIPLYSVDVNYMINDSTGYIKVSRFAGNTYQEFMEACNHISSQGASQFIIDLRGNPGGYLTAVIQMVNEFLPQDAMIVYTEGRSRPRQESRANGQGRYPNKKVVVLIDEFSASASEIFSGALQDNDRAVIVGRRSFGKGLVQEQIPFNDGSALRLTVARYYIPSGRSIQKPYADGIEDYYSDIYHRIEHGELTDADSIHFSDSLRYETLGGRTVYGGGGVMPDAFVPADTTSYSEYFSKVVRKGLVYRFALDYSDSHRTALNAIKDVNDFQNYLEQQNIMKQFIAMAEDEGVKTDREGLRISGKVIETQIMAYIARNILGDEGFYPIFHENDKAFIKAVSIISDQEDYSSLLSNETNDID